MSERDIPAATERRCRWFRRAAGSIRVLIVVLTLVCSVVAGIIAARALGGESPWVWTIALVAGVAGGVVLMGNPRLHALADRLERSSQEGEGEGPYAE